MTNFSRKDSIEVIYPYHDARRHGMRIFFAVNAIKVSLHRRQVRSCSRSTPGSGLEKESQAEMK